jgi:hypothetical protein
MRCTVIIFLFAALTASSCSSKRSTVKPSSPGTALHAPASNNSGADTSKKNIIADSLLASIHRAPCYGTCPVYTFTVYRSGYSVYHGERNVERVGVYSSWLNKEETEKIKEEAEKISYFKLKESYVDRNIADLPWVTTCLNINGRKKCIENDNHQPVEGLKSFELFLDSVAEGKEWKLTGGEKE